VVASDEYVSTSIQAACQPQLSSCVECIEPCQVKTEDCVCVCIRHIYIPLGGSRHGQARRFFASLMCFAYVCLWHGMWTNITFWVAANFIGVTVEALGDQLSSDPRLRQFEVGCSMLHYDSCSCSTDLFSLRKRK